jgi:hypothetical protein
VLVFWFFVAFKGSKFFLSILFLTNQKHGVIEKGGRCLGHVVGGDMQEESSGEKGKQG